MSRVRNLTKTLAMVSLLAPSSGYSLGIGDIKLHSALNQNLDAEISLILSSGEKTSDIKVNLAPPDKFDEAGVPWTSLLSKIKFETVVGANGSVTVKLRSREAVKEPFLVFLVEVNWPKGRLYREFTVLLDPPTAYRQATIPVLTRSENYESEQAVILQRQSKQRRRASVEGSTNEASQSSGASEYGPIRKNETLGKVAEQASRQEGVSVEQMMIAIYKENPHAFYKESVHALLAGKNLKIPGREVVLKISKKNALAELNRQTKAWKNRLSPAPIETVSAKKDAPDNQLTLVAPTEAEVTEKALLTPENAQITAKKKADDVASKTADKEIVNSVSPVNAAIQDKVAELEKQMAVMQQILALKDQQLANLQNQLQAKPPIQPEVVQVTPPVSPGAVNPAVEPKPVPPDANNPVTQTKPVQTEVKPIIQVEPEAASSSNTPYLWIGVGAAGTLSLLGWLWWRKRKLDELNIDQNPFSSRASDAPEFTSFFSTSIEKDSHKNLDAGVSNSFFNESTISDFDTFDIDEGEIDPVSEADVYLAYGRYQQAEELMRDILREQPNRDDCKLKLLEIFYSNENKLAFENYANELADSGKKDDVEFWAKVTEMGSGICHGSELFSSKLDESSAKENIIFEKKPENLVESHDVEKNEVPDIQGNNLNLSSFDQSFINKADKEKSQPIDNSLNFDFISFEDEGVDEQQNNKSIDFDLSTIAVKTEKSSDTLGSVASKVQEHEFESFDFDFGSNETEAKEVVEIATIGEKSTFESQQLNDVFSDDSLDVDNSFANDTLDNDFYFDQPISELDEEDFDQQDGLEFFDLTDMDELETKLDLAKAYIDMNDSDAAKDMAFEVLEKGTSEQKKTAQALLDDLK